MEKHRRIEFGFRKTAIAVMKPGIIDAVVAQWNKQVWLMFCSIRRKLDIQVCKGGFEVYLFF